jgi:hypothetical protein
MAFIDILMLVGRWSNENQGIVSVAIFIITIAFGWFSGVFSALRRRPKFKVTIIPGPTFCCTFPVGKKNGDYDVHRTGVALYLNIANIGSAPSSVENITIGYHWHLKPFSIPWVKYTLGWFWLNGPSTILADFHVMIGENIKVFPFLIQKNYLSSFNVETFLEVGRATTGVVYFEQGDSWGGCFPSVHNGVVSMRVRIRDVFGKNHYEKFDIPSVSLEEARKYNPAFGKTLAELRGEALPFDAA